MPYQLYYSPTPQGRGEFVRLAREAAGAPCIDIARGRDDAGQGVRALLQSLDDPVEPHLPFAPPDLRDGKFVVGQTSAILFYLGPALKLVARSEQAQAWTHQVQSGSCATTASRCPRAPGSGLAHCLAPLDDLSRRTMATPW